MKSFLVLFLISLLSLNVYADISDIEIIEKSTNPFDSLRLRPEVPFRKLMIRPCEQ